MDMREIGCGDMNLIALAQNRAQWKDLVNMVMSLWVPQNITKFSSNCATDDFSRRAQLYGGKKTSGL
jgi:hypothetical protein